MEPGATSPERASRNRAEIQEFIEQAFSGVPMLEAQDIAESVTFAVTRDGRASVNEIVTRPTDQVEGRAS